MRQVFIGWGVAMKRKAAEAAYDIFSAPVAAVRNIPICGRSRLFFLLFPIRMIGGVFFAYKEISDIYNGLPGLHGPSCRIEPGPDACPSV